MKSFQRILCAAVLLALSACRKPTPEDRILKALYPSAFLNDSSRPIPALHNVVMPLPGDSTKTIVICWGNLPLMHLDNSHVTFQVVEGLEENPTTVATSYLTFGYLEEIQSLQVDPELLTIGSGQSAISVKIIRTITSVQPPLFIESHALFQLREKEFKNILNCETGFYETDTSDLNAVHATLSVDSAQTADFSNLLLKDTMGRMTSFHWDAAKYNYTNVSSDQHLAVNLYSITPAQGTVPVVEATGKGEAFRVEGNALYPLTLYNFPPETDIRVALSARDAVTPSLCSKLISLPLPPHMRLIIRGFGTFENTSDNMQFSANLTMTTLSSCFWSNY